MDVIEKFLDGQAAIERQVENNLRAAGRFDADDLFEFAKNNIQKVKMFSYCNISHN